MRIDLDAVAALRAKTYRVEDLLDRLIHLSEEIGKEAAELPFSTPVPTHMNELAKELEKLTGKASIEGDYLEDMAREYAARPETATMRILEDETDDIPAPTAHDLALLLVAVEGDDIGTREEVQNAAAYLIGQLPELVGKLRRLGKLARETPGSTLRDGSIPPEILCRAAKSDIREGER